jgi:AraC-like DNA-binding protein
MPLVLLYFNKGYLTANRYLAVFLFAASLCALENFYVYYGKSLNKIAFFTCIHAFFYLIGPFAFFYMRSILRDNSLLSKTDYLHFALFALSFIGYVPYFFSSWDYKLMVAQNLYSANWNIAPFHLNSIFPHKIDQALNVLHPYFYSIALWYLLWHYKKKTNNPKLYKSQHKLIRNWLLVFASILTIITINFTIVMVYVWLYDDKSIFLNRASVALLFASLVYVGMNLVIFFFPHIMYGLPIDLKLESMAIEEKQTNNDTPSNSKVFNFSIKEESLNQISKNELQLFTPEYRKTIAAALQSFKERKVFLNPDFKLNQISNESNIPAHHLTYFFNDIKKISFSDWRNSLRIEEAKILIGQGETDNFTLQSISLRCGFSSQNTFIRAFKSSTGTTPSTYLKSVS